MQDGPPRGAPRTHVHATLSTSHAIPTFPHALAAAQGESFVGAATVLITAEVGGMEDIPEGVTVGVNGLMIHITDYRRNTLPPRPRIVLGRPGTENY